MRAVTIVLALFAAWAANAAARDDYDTDAERAETLAYLRRARALYAVVR